MTLKLSKEGKRRLARATTFKQYLNRKLKNPKFKKLWEASTLEKEVKMVKKIALTTITILALIITILSLLRYIWLRERYLSVYQMLEECNYTLERR